MNFTTPRYTVDPAASSPTLTRRPSACFQRVGIFGVRTFASVERNYLIRNELRQRSHLSSVFLETRLCRNIKTSYRVYRFPITGGLPTFRYTPFPTHVLLCVLTIHTKTARPLLGALGLDKISIYTICGADSNSKCLNIVADAAAVNKLAAKTATLVLGTKNYRTYYIWLLGT